MALLEDVVRFVAQLGGAAPSGLAETLLQEYVLHTLLLPPEQWEAVATPAIAQHVRLSHVGSLLKGMSIVSR